MEQNGYVKLHRVLLDNPISKKPQYAWLWATLLLLANHKPNKFMWNGEIIIIKEGQLLTGRKQLSEKTGIPESTVEDILKYLETQQQIQQQKTTKFRLITIVNWTKYQISNNKSNNKATTKQQQADTNKNDKNDKKNIGETSSPRKLSPKKKIPPKEIKPFNSSSYVMKLTKDKQRHIRIVGWFFQSTAMTFPSLRAVQKEIGRHLKDAAILADYEDDRVANAVDYVKKKFPDEWKLSTVLKYINKI